MRAAACAASHPAWPAPTITTSYCSSNILLMAARGRACIVYGFGLSASRFARSAHATYLCRTWRICDPEYLRSPLLRSTRSAQTNRHTDPREPFREELG